MRSAVPVLFAILCTIITGGAARSQDLEEMAAPRYLDAPRQLLVRGEILEAIRTLRKMEAARPASGDIVLLLAHAYYRAGQKRLFAEKAKAAAALLPESPLPDYALGRYYLDDLQRQELAEQSFKKALTRHPGHGPSLYHLGWCRELDRHPDEAEIYYRRSGIWLGSAGLARLALDRNDREEALSHAREAVRMAGNQSQAHAVLARVLQRLERYKEAISAYRRATELDSTDAKLHYQLSRCAAAIGDRALQKESIARYEELRSVYGTN
jgi:tetratricopeptide (TPR) repeat protein